MFCRPECVVRCAIVHLSSRNTKTLEVASSSVAKQGPLNRHVTINNTSLSLSLAEIRFCFRQVYLRRKKNLTSSQTRGTLMLPSLSVLFLESQFEQNFQ
jgi:hypothetical protein